MTVVQTLSGLQSARVPLVFNGGQGSLNLYQYTADYASIYRTQPNVRTVVEFLARNIAQLGLHAYRRVSDLDRVRAATHPADQLRGVLPPWETRYRALNSLVHDLGIYLNAYWLKLKSPNRPLALLRVPPQFMSVVGVLMPTEYRLQLQWDEPRTFTPAEVIHFRGHNPDSQVLGLSPLETLRRILAEEASAGDYRAGFWNNAARMSGIVTRPATAPEWSTTARERFRAEFEALYTGKDNSGRTAILEEGMTFQGNTFSAEDSEYIAGRKLTREEVARAYHIPLPLVGILDHATFSNVEEQHKHLYQDTLGPWCVMIEEELELQLLPDLPQSGDVYLEFNIAEKLKGSFEEQASSLSTLVGRPVMTANEGRARLNLPQQGGDADELVTPLNVMVGGQPSPQTPVGDNAPKALAARESKAVDPTRLTLRARHAEKWRGVLEKFFERQRVIVVGRLSKNRKAAASDLFDEARWNRELGADVLKLGSATATVFAKQVADELGTDYDPDIMLPWLKENSRITAEGVNKQTLAQIQAALEEDDELDALQNVFNVASGSRAAQIAATKVTTVANFGAHDAAAHSGLKSKTWQVNSGRPRPTHARMNGSSVAIQDNFSNGMKWPGDPDGGADEVANCTCSVTFE